jgi:hypothetical protein
MAVSNVVANLTKAGAAYRKAFPPKNLQQPAFWEHGKYKNMQNTLTSNNKVC